MGHVRSDAGFRPMLDVETDVMSRVLDDGRRIFRVWQEVSQVALPTYRILDDLGLVCLFRNGEKLAGLYCVNRKAGERRAGLPTSRW
jgi:hypothetical protein